MLRHIYRKRRRLLWGTLGGSVLFLQGIGPPRYAHAFTYLCAYVAILGSFLTYISYLLFTKLRPLKKDIRERSGLYLPKVIIRKDFFPHAGTYFIFFDDLKFPHKEVNREVYERCEAGGICLLPVGMHSGIVLDGFMNYDLL